MMQVRRVCDYADPTAGTGFTEMTPVLHAERFQLPLPASDEKKPALGVERKTAGAGTATFPARHNCALAKIDRQRRTARQVGVTATAFIVDHKRFGAVRNIDGRRVSGLRKAILRQR